jgi:diketogulonate reductase-like aldo/keto reductase
LQFFLRYFLGRKRGFLNEEGLCPPPPRFHHVRNSIPRIPLPSDIAMSVKLSITDKLHMPKCAAQIPRLGFGVYRSSTSQCIESCTTALKVGYRHIDTAQFYENEAEVGAAIRQSGLKRDDVFITTKILSAGGSFAKSLQKCIDSVDKIDGKEGYVDCFLVHSPNGGKEKRKEMWQALEKLYEIGKAKSIGVSNYGIGHIEEMKAYAKVWPPHVNQIEVSWFSLAVYPIGCTSC